MRSGAARKPQQSPSQVPSPSRSDSEQIPQHAEETRVELLGRVVHLTNLQKVFWPASGHTKGDLLRYYLAVSPWLLPHIQGRAMVMKRYPHGIDGPFFFMKRIPEPHPEWVATCSIEHASGNVIAFPVVRDAATLLWLVNLGCIDLNPWYGRCDDVHRPDYLHFDLDPGQASFELVRRTALELHETLQSLGMPDCVKTSGSKGLHVYVPIVRGPMQKQVWTAAKAIAQGMAARLPKLVTAEYRIARRPEGRVLIDYNQNAWGRTLASVYSVRPREPACVSAPVTWQEVESGIRIEDFRMDNLMERMKQVGDLFAPAAPDAPGRFDFGALR